jgi:hypothetical protein
MGRKCVLVELLLKPRRDVVVNELVNNWVVLEKWFSEWVFLEELLFVPEFVLSFTVCFGSKFRDDGLGIKAGPAPSSELSRLLNLNLIFWLVLSDRIPSLLNLLRINLITLPTALNLSRLLFKAEHHSVLVNDLHTLTIPIIIIITFNTAFNIVS